MELLAIVLLLIILFTLFSFKSSVNERLTSLQEDLKELRKIAQKNVTSQAAADISEKHPDEEPTAKKDTWQSGFKVMKNVSPSNSPAIPQPEKPAPQKPKEPEVRVISAGSTSSKAKAPSFFERHPDLERFIGENLVSKIGIAILVLAIAYFVKYAIDNNWIGTVGRVGIGLLSGGILIALAHRIRINYKAFSSVLVGGGLAVLYFTITLAYHQFHLFSQTASFIIMVVITIFAVVLSLLYDRQELAIIALVGGFLTPLMVSDGAGNFKTLFVYLLILNSGLLVIAYNRSWRILNICAFCSTALLFFLWLVELKNPIPDGTRGSGLLFATLFYVLFFVINILHNIKEKRAFIASDFSILLANTALYYSAGLHFLDGISSGDFKGLFTACLGAFNLAASWILFRKQTVDKNILYLLIGITISFISLTAPVQLEGNNITLFWATESVLLYWLYQRASIGLIRITSLVIWTAMMISLLMDWSQFYFAGSQHGKVILNTGFITSLYSALCTFLLFILRKRDDSIAISTGKRFPIASVFQIASLVLLFMTGALEIGYQFSYHFKGTGISLQYLLLYTYAFSVALFLTQTFRGTTSSPIALYLLSACLVIYIAAIPYTFALQQLALNQQRYSLHILAHWIGMLLLCYMFFVITRYVRTRFQGSQFVAVYAGLLCFWLIVFFSVEVNLLVQQVYFKGPGSLDAINGAYVRSGLPILWGICSFAFMWLGMKHKFRPLRIISLGVFSITLIKLFAFDIRNISVGGKIAAFFCLGVLLLIISFMYQRLKKIIIEDAEKPVV